MIFPVSGLKRAAALVPAISASQTRVNALIEPGPFPPPNPPRLRGREREGGGESKGFEDFRPRDFVHDKDEPAAPILVGPIFEPFRREQRVLGGLYDSRVLGPVGKAHDAFDPEQVIAALAGEPAERSGEIETAEVAVEHHPEGVDAMSVGRDRLCRNDRCRRSRAGTE